MSDVVEVEKLTEILFTMQGQHAPKAHNAHSALTVAEFVAIVASDIDETVEVFIGDADEPLAGELVLIECLSVESGPLHVAHQHAKITVTVEYDLKKIEREFRPSSTIARITRWAIGPEGLGLEGDPSDYQLSHDGEVLAPETHVGQVEHHEKAHFTLERRKQIEVELVWGGTGASKEALVDLDDTAGQVFDLVYREFQQQKSDEDTFEVNSEDFPKSRFGETVRALEHCFGKELVFEVIPPTSGA